MPSIIDLPEYGPITCTEQLAAAGLSVRHMTTGLPNCPPISNLCLVFLQENAS